MAILPVAAVGGDLADIDFRIEICRKRVPVVAGIRIENINIVDFVELVFQGIGGKNTGNTGSKPLPRSAVIPAFLKRSR